MSSAANAVVREIRVLIVDDSPFMRRSLERLLSKSPGVRIVGTAADGIEAVRKVLELRPDVVTMDVAMPRMDGVAAVEEIMSVLPTPIVMVSSLTSEGSDIAIQALEAGAVECVAKPSGIAGELADVADQLTGAILRASHARVRRRRVSLVNQRLSPVVHAPRASKPLLASKRVLIIGSSTGGPPALTAIVPLLPANFPAGVLVVQHMPAGFTAALARRLDSLSPLVVREAAEADLIAAGQVLIAPGDFHATIAHDRRVHLSQGASLHGVRPAIDVTLESVVHIYGKDATVVILTGMGRDGAQGAAGIEAAGGSILVQDEATSVVYGMPKVTRERTRAAIEAPLPEMAAAIIRAVGGR